MRGEGGGVEMVGAGVETVGSGVEIVGAEVKTVGDGVKMVGGGVETVGRGVAPTTGDKVGFIVGRAVGMNKKVLCLYRPQEGKLLSAMIRGLDNGSNLRTIDYSPEQAEQIFTDFLGPPTRAAQ